MSDFGRSGDSPTSGDVWRYAWLGLLGVLVLLAVFSQFEGGPAILLALLLVTAVGAAVVVLVRRSRS